nr:hypothetical protein [uncultured Rhodococcus sp.]
MEPIRAPRGSELSCKGWEQEAALRMLMNNLDPEVAEDPDHLVVYGGTGRAARSWEAYDAIVETLRDLADDETLLVQSGKPVAVISASPSGYGAKWAHEHARKAVGIAGGRVLEHVELTIGGTSDKFGAAHPRENAVVSAEISEVVAELVRASNELLAV